jgi:predicted phosphodiesterase
MNPPGISQTGNLSRILPIVLMTLLLSVILPAFLPAAGAVPDGTAAPGTGIVWGPWITGTSPTGTIIHVKTAIPANVTVQYGPEDDFRKTGTYRYTVSDNGSTLLHQVTLTGLYQGTRYHYRVITGGNSTDDCHFLTFPVSGCVTFIVYGDSRDPIPLNDQNLRHHLVAERISQEKDVSFVLHTGDILTDSSNLSDWDRFFAAGGVLLANTTFVPVRGNHEQDTPLWEEIFGTAPAYSFDCGPAHVTVLNSNDNVWSRLGCETAWLSGDLMTQKPWKFVALHHPLYSSEAKHVGGWKNLRDAWEGLFIAQGVTAVFQGHVHAYERDMAGGVTYITEGRGGSPFYALNETKIPSYKTSRENSLGYTRIDLNPLGGVATFTVIQVAEFADDGTSLLTPEGTVVEKFVLSPPHSRGTSAPLPEAQPLRKSPVFLSGFKPFYTPVF